MIPGCRTNAEGAVITAPSALYGLIFIIGYW